MDAKVLKNLLDASSQIENSIQDLLEDNPETRRLISQCRKLVATVDLLTHKLQAKQTEKGTSTKLACPQDGAILP